MLFNEDLENIIFNRHEIIESDELVIVSGFIGPHPLERVEEIPLLTTVVYGMYGSVGIKNSLHNPIVQLNNSIKNLTVLYSEVPVHSKCYIWKKNNCIVHALIGSANFSVNGLRTPFREILAETTRDTFIPLQTYLERILNHSIVCTNATVRGVQTGIQLLDIGTDEHICRMTLLDPRTNETHLAGGINWGHGNSHTTPDDAYIAIRSSHIRNYPSFFPPKQEYPQDIRGGRPRRHNDFFEMIWDDGTIMQGLMEGSYQMNGDVFPKQISSFPSKSVLGFYLRQRIGMNSGAFVRRVDLERYGRTHIDVSLLNEGVYYFDFSV